MSSCSMTTITAAGDGGFGRGGGSRGGRSWPSTTSVSSSGKRIQKEMSELSMDHPPDFSAGPKGDNLYHWVATLFGPPHKPLVSGIAQLYLADRATQIGCRVDSAIRQMNTIKLTVTINRMTQQR